MDVTVDNVRLALVMAGDGSCTGAVFDVTGSADCHHGVMATAPGSLVRDDLVVGVAVVVGGAAVVPGHGPPG